MRRAKPFASCARAAIPRRTKVEILLRQHGRCADCGTRLDMERIVFDHRPPLALREPDADPNDPEGSRRSASAAIGSRPAATSSKSPGRSGWRLKRPTIGSVWPTRSAATAPRLAAPNANWNASSATPLHEDQTSATARRDVRAAWHKQVGHAVRSTHHGHGFIRRSCSVERLEWGDALVPTCRAS